MLATDYFWTLNAIENPSGIEISMLARALKKRPRHACGYWKRMIVHLMLSPAVP